jgi:hypothetical protein
MNLPLANTGSATPTGEPGPPPALALAVLGDSDSQGYHDRLWTPAGRGGEHAAATLQWTEVLAQLRPSEVNLGPKAIWGQRKLLVRWLEHLAWPPGAVGKLRAPRKEDHRHNFAFAGARCEDLTQGAMRQVPRLLSLMTEAPEVWREGVVVVRIGVNNFGFESSLSRLAQDPDDPEIRRRINACLEHIRNSVDMIHAVLPSTRFVLVGIFNNAHWPPNLGMWRSKREMHNIDTGLDRFDDALGAMAARDSRLAFFDDRAWFAERWGARDAEGHPAYRALQLGPKAPPVNMSQGNEPWNAVLSDGHAGLVWNLQWAQSLVELLRHAFGLQLAAISNQELEAFVPDRPAGASW